MNPADQFIPRFPSHYVGENQGAFDVSESGIVACATGSTIHLSYLNGAKLVRGYSAQIGKNPITALKFDTNKRQLAVGNSRGSVYLVDIDTRNPIAACTFSKDRDPVLALEWRHSILIVLWANKKLAALSYSAAVSTDKSGAFQHQHFSVIWEITLPVEHTRMVLNPHSRDMLLLSREGPEFSIYKFVSTTEAPVQFMGLVEMSCGGQIHDAQWCLSMPQQILLVLGDEIVAFSIVTQGIAPVAHQQRVASPFKKILQFPSNGKHVFVMHMSGTISILNSEDPTNLTLEKELIHKEKPNTLVNWCQAPLDDNRIVLWYSPMGIGVYDDGKQSIVSLLPLCSSRITSFSTDGVSLAIGRSDGSIVCSDLFDMERTNVFKVASEPVLFTALCPGRNRVYWHTKSSLGAVELSSRFVRLFGGRALPVTKAIGSFEGALVVQRTPLVLGVFVNDIESPVLLEKPALDLCFDEGNAGIDEGCFAVLIESFEILLYRYNRHKVRLYKRLGSFYGSLTPMSLAWRDNTFIFGTQEGSVHTINLALKKIEARFRHQNWKPKSLSFYEGEVYGISSQGYLFAGDKQTSVHVLDYFPISRHLILVLRANGVLELLTMPDFQPLLQRSSMLPIQSRQELIKSKLLGAREETYFTADGRDAWLCLRDDPPLRMNALCGVGDAGKFIDCEIALTKTSQLTPAAMKMKLFSQLLFANRFTEASDVLLTADIEEQDYVHSVLLASVALGFTKSISDKQQARLKASAIMLLQSGSFEEGAMLLRLGMLDRDAVKYLLDYNRVGLAVRFVRSMQDAEEKRRGMLKCGMYLLQRGKVKRSVPFFAGCREFHPLLFALYTLGEIMDCYFLKKYAESKELLKPLDPNLAKECNNMLGFDELCAMIDAEFQSLLCELNVDMDEVLPPAV